MRIKSLAQGENILMLGIEPSTFVSKVDILTTTPINQRRSLLFLFAADSEFTINEELLSLVPMNGTTIAKDLLDTVLKVMVDFNLDHKLLRGITTDGTPSMMRKINGLAVRLEKYVVDNGGDHYLNFIALSTNKICVPEA